MPGTSNSGELIGILRTAVAREDSTRSDRVDQISWWWDEGLISAADGPMICQVLIWGVRIEPSSRVREDFLDPLAGLTINAMDAGQAAALLMWMRGLELSVTEEEYEAAFAEFAWDEPEPEPLDPVRCARGVDLVRGLTSTSTEERLRAARLVREVLPLFPEPTERAALAGVLAHLVVVESDAEALEAQREAVGALDDVGAVDAWHREVMASRAHLPGFD